MTQINTVTRQGHEINRNDKGQLPLYAWPGAATITYYTENGEPMCGHCARKIEADVRENGDESLYTNIELPAFASIRHEGPPIECCHESEDCPYWLYSQYGFVEWEDQGRCEFCGSSDKNHMHNCPNEDMGKVAQ